MSGKILIKQLQGWFSGLGLEEPFLIPKDKVGGGEGGLVIRHKVQIDVIDDMGQSEKNLNFDLNLVKNGVSFLLQFSSRNLQINIFVN